MNYDEFMLWGLRIRNLTNEWNCCELVTAVCPKNDDASVMLGISRSPNGIAAPTDVWKMSEPSRHIPSFPIFDDEVLLPV